MKKKKVLKFQTEKQITLRYILAKFLSFEVPYIISISYIGYDKQRSLQANIELRFYLKVRLRPLENLTSMVV